MSGATTVYEILGTIGLIVLWSEAVLVAAAAVQELRDLRALSLRTRLLGPGEVGLGMISGEVESAPEGVLAQRSVVQIGRALDARLRSIAFRDRSSASLVRGGRIRTELGVVEIERCEQCVSVWTPIEASPRPEAFDEAYADACAPAGHLRTLSASVARGDRIFVSGDVSTRGEVRVMRAPSGGDLLLFAADPRRILTRRRWLVSAFIAGELAACLVCTRTATWPPLFGAISTLGGALGLAFFLGVTPIGVWVRDRCRSWSPAPAVWSECSTRSKG
jgi:hypothetical protein